MSNITMTAKDALSAKMAECFVTIEGKRYNAFNFLDVEIEVEKTKQEIPILGKTGKGNKSSGWKGTGKAKMYYNTSIFREILMKFIETGEDVYFDMQITNEDKGSAAGKQTVVVTGCNANGGIMAKFDAASDDPLDEEIEFTFEGIQMKDKFNLLNGML